MNEISGWGGHPRVRARESVPEDLEQASREPVLFRGLGRSYGDASLPAAEGARVVSTRHADRILRFDPDTATLRAEAGAALADLNRALLARGFAVPVVPGTQYVTLGGMVACDIHGKNHHSAGTLGRHVRSLALRVADGRVLDVSAESEPELFAATLGGMGLTGQILEVELELLRAPSPWIYAETRAYPDLESLVAAMRAASAEFPYTVAWSDTTARGRRLGRGILVAGRFARPDEARARAPRWRRPPQVPFGLPSGVVAPWSIPLLNHAWYWLQGRTRSGIVHPKGFFHPLDVVGGWNKLYGRRGFVQHQCVLPAGDDLRVLRRLYEILALERGASFVTVVKDLGAEGQGLLSFPRPGLTLALDLAMQGAATRALVDALNDEVAAAGGRIYLAKDALTRREHFRAMEPRLDAWNAVRRRWDPDAKLRSALSVRLLGDDA